MHDQIKKLYNQISDSTNAARNSKRDLRMLLDGDELQTYLQFAFDHFSDNLVRPFDFVQASFIFNPIPSDFAGNILKLAVGMMDIWEHMLDGESIFRELSHMVASCIMLDSARSKTLGSAELIFPEYVESCDNALEDFCDRYWPCEFVMKIKTKRGKAVGGRCVNVRSGHGSKGHQFKNGKVIAVGTYQSKFSAESFQETFRYLVFAFLKDLLEELKVTSSKFQPEDQTAANIHKDLVLRPFYAHVSKGRTTLLSSHSTCFSCLMASPEHPLPCGHIICTPCLIAYGKQQERDTIELTSCPFHAGTFSRWVVYLKPSTAGARVLTLDGGGIRGIVELEVLRLIENVWGGALCIQDFLDLIVGTSTGGVIALGLASKGWTVNECIYHFTELCEKAFTRRFGINVPGMGMIVESLNQSKYETVPLEQSLQTGFSEDEYLFGGPRIINHRVKVAVTATSSGSVSVLANYNRNCDEKMPYNFQRPERLASELKIWEAARATSAAPRIFKPFPHEASKQVYLDGAIYYNNPIVVADLERKLLWPADGVNLPDLILSIGTAMGPEHSSPLRKSTERSPRSLNIFGLGHAKALADIALDHVRSSLDSEKTWSDYILQLGLTEDHKGRYQRINPRISGGIPALDEVHRLKDLQIEVRNEMAGQPVIKTAAYRLLATSFYFEEAESLMPLFNGMYFCTGKFPLSKTQISHNDNPSPGRIRCRLPTSKLEHLGRFLSTSHERSVGPYFIIREHNRPLTSEQIPITSETMADLRFKYRWNLSPVKLLVSGPASLIEIVLCIARDEEYPISGFPRMMQNGSLRSPIHRAYSSAKRWRSRTSSQQNRRKKWTEPVLPDLSKENQTSPSLLRNYSEADYLVANSTEKDLDDIKYRLGHDLVPMPSGHEIFFDLTAFAGQISEIADNQIYEMADMSRLVELDALNPQGFTCQQNENRNRVSEENETSQREPASHWFERHSRQSSLRFKVGDYEKEAIDRARLEVVDSPSADSSNNIRPGSLEYPDASQSHKEQGRHSVQATQEASVVQTQISERQTALEPIGTLSTLQASNSRSQLNNELQDSRSVSESPPSHQKQKFKSKVGFRDLFR
ncbi:hypothetical protein PVAG01_04730 [Phlyctema vagabunda]|uniref:FabD/lysophospholipase-like protein n=1 Tax=Phlyctema vagabunda TaxID=108571 RepID=A0ABR4PI21_9HELO